MLFEEIRNDWYTDPDLWPQDRSLNLFRKWRRFELHTVVVDTGGGSATGDTQAGAGRLGVR
jgi:hypothetical protein